MAPRRKSAAPTYAQLFCDGSGTSSSGPSSSDVVPDSQPSQRVAWSPPSPPQMPPPPPPVHLIRICVCLHMPHSRNIRWRICLPSLVGRVWMF
ncbi:hypothetical protein F2Q70_00021758 [Brassica cretica]|uniref:Uncharacterized protein n=1 Tax=Brassica cretica TaxID=69181 RepID=A0A8S9GZV8_BRACR|nr:hypothetical protein F2Q70_00021758 [Brassica cretica]